MTTRLTLLAAIVAALAAPSAADAGGWATVGLDPPPDGVAPGEPWQAELTVLQHGVTPLEGVKPSVLVRRQGERAAEERVFTARATEMPGVYRATVVFPSAGTWRYRVDDGFAGQHTFPPVQVGRPAAHDAVAATSAAAATPPSDNPPTGDGGGPDYLLATLAAAVAALGAGLAAAALQRRRGGPTPAGG